jgi:hypothetical protein
MDKPIDPYRRPSPRTARFLKVEQEAANTAKAIKAKAIKARQNNMTNNMTKSMTNNIAESFIIHHIALLLAAGCVTSSLFVALLGTCCVVGNIIILPIGVAFRLLKWALNARQQGCKPLPRMQMREEQRHSMTKIWQTIASHPGILTEDSDFNHDSDWETPGERDRWSLMKKLRSRIRRR